MKAFYRKTFEMQGFKVFQGKCFQGIKETRKDT